MTVLRFAAALALGLATAGCAAFGQLNTVSERIEEATAPVQLYLLTPARSFAPGLPRSDYQVIIEEPLAASHLDTDRIAVMPAPLSVEYLPVARWADRAPLLVQGLLVESFENSGGLASVSGQRVAVASDFLLLPDLRAFHAVAAGGPEAPLLVHVRLNLKIVEEDSGLIVASESFGAEAAAAFPDALPTVTAFDEALREVLQAAVAWTLTRIADWEPPEDPFALEG